MDDIRQANCLLNDLSLFEPLAVCRRFTWTNGQSDPIWVKLYRFLVNYEWRLRFPRTIQASLPSLGSDYVMIRLEVGEHFSLPRPFRFEMAWCTVEGFHELIQQWWIEEASSGCGAFAIAKKKAWLNKKLSHWA